MTKTAIELLYDLLKLYKEEFAYDSDEGIYYEVDRVLEDVKDRVIGK